MLIIEVDQYCSPKNVTKAMLHIEQYNVSRETLLDTQRQQHKRSHDL